MPQFLASPKRGRPPKTAVEKLRDRIWIHVVKLRSSLTTGYMLENTVEADQVKRVKGHISRPRKWDRYVKGERGPGQIKGKRDSVLLAEIEFPGTARWHRNPIWQALEREQRSAKDWDTALRSLEPSVIQVLFALRTESWGEELRPVAFDEVAADRLVSLGSFDALAATVILVRLAEVIASPPLRDLALGCYGRLQPIVSRLPELAQFYEELFSLIDTHCKHWVFVSPNERMEVVIFWQGMRDNAWGEDE